MLKSRFFSTFEILSIDLPLKVINFKWHLPTGSSLSLRREKEQNETDFSEPSAQQKTEKQSLLEISDDIACIKWKRCLLELQWDFQRKRTSKSPATHYLLFIRGLAFSWLFLWNIPRLVFLITRSKLRNRKTSLTRRRNAN